MKRSTRKRVATGLLIGVIVVCVMLLSAVLAEAKGVSGKVKDPDGNIFIVQNSRIRVGAFRWHGKRFYAHTTMSRYYPVGSLTVDAFRRLADGRWYYYQRSGAALMKSTRYVRLRNNGTVKYIYTPGTNMKQRYSTALCRYQIKKRGKWKDVGMQCFPYGQMDLQR